MWHVYTPSSLSLQQRRRQEEERERGEGEKTQKVVSPAGLESVSSLCSGGFQERGAQAKVTLGIWGCLLSPRLLRDCLTWESRTAGISFLQWLFYRCPILFKSFHSPSGFWVEKQLVLDLPGPSRGRSLPAEGVLPFGPSTHWESPKHTSHELDSPTPHHMRVAPSRTDSTILRWTAPKGARRHKDKPQTKDQETWDRIHYLHEFGQFLHLCRPRFPQITVKRWIGEKILDQDPWGPRICTGDVVCRYMFLVTGFSRQCVTSPNLRAIAGASVQPCMCLKCSWLYQTSRWAGCLKSPDFVLCSDLYCGLSNDHNHHIWPP